MNVMSRTHGYLNPVPYPELVIFVERLGRLSRRVGHVLLVVTGLRTRPSRHRYVGRRGATWLELIAHYLVALFVWSSKDGEDSSALGRAPRVVVATLTLVGFGFLFGSGSV